MLTHVFEGTISTSYLCFILPIRLNLQQFMEQLKHFALLDRDKDGYITIDDLAIYLEVANNRHLQQVFKACHPVSALFFFDYLIMYD